MKRFNANACISPEGKIHKTYCMNHLNTLMDVGNYKSIGEQLEDEDEVIMPDKWQDKMVHEHKWLMVSGVEYWENTVYRVSCAARPTKASINALFDIAWEAHKNGDELTFIQLNEEYKKLK